uniref:DUF4190 domain-containing protein n=1 Tax=Acrobeloides nanus TaxID=290746 RepID=A0A914CBD0_9BILA
MLKEHCCCGRIHTGALIIGYLILIFGIIGLLASVVTGNGRGIVSNVLNALVGGCILYADKYQKPGGYLPHLILAGIGIAIYTVGIALFVIMAIFVPGTLSNYIQDYGYEAQDNDREIDPKTASRGMLLFVAAVLAFIDWISIYLWMVVYRAYQLMKGVEEDGRRQTYQGV